MDEGFIYSNKYRRAIFNELAAGETNIQRIAKKHRIIKSVAVRVMQEFQKQGIVEKQGDQYQFTAEGKRLADSIGT